LSSLGKLLAGLAVLLALAELGFAWRDDFAWAHLNVYQADERLGVALRPGAEQRVKLGDNPATEVAIGAHGHRGEPWGDAVDVMVLGDSQVFGLGVEEDERFSDVLAASTGLAVANVGVPTYGPSEMLLQVEQMLATDPDVVIWTVNVGNDLFEVGKPNRERHAVWDGWSVRAETAPERVTAFPGRAWLMRESHLVFAVRRAVYLLRERADLWAGLDSEGGWHDLLSASERAAVRQARQEPDRSEVEATLMAARKEVRERAWWEDAGGSDDDYLAFLGAEADPGDIVLDQNYEPSRSIEVTARHLREGAKARAKVHEAMRRRGAAAAEAVEAVEAAEAQLLALRSSPGTPDLAALSPIAVPLLEAHRLCEEAGARLLVAVLPLDVQIDPEAWDRYGVEPVPLDTALNDALLRDLRDLGVHAVDLALPLTRALPGAFLDGDLHMTPKGHAAVAARLAQALDEAPPTSRWAPLDEGRSAPPSPTEWMRQRENLVRGSSAAGCETKAVREWLRVSCQTRLGGVEPVAIDLVSDPRGEAMTVVSSDAATLVVPLLGGDRVEADFRWRDRTQRLVLDGTASPQRRSFEAPEPDSEATGSPEDQALCTAWKADQGVEHCEDLSGASEAGCHDGERWDWACVRGDPSARPSCRPDQVRVGVAGHCAEP